MRFARPTLRNWNGFEIGAVRVVAPLLFEPGADQVS
jgi:hypothetical protein